MRLCRGQAKRGKSAGISVGFKQHNSVGNICIGAGSAGTSNAATLTCTACPAGSLLGRPACNWDAEPKRPGTLGSVVFWLIAACTARPMEAISAWKERWNWLSETARAFKRANMMPEMLSAVPASSGSSMCRTRASLSFVLRCGQRPWRQNYTFSLMLSYTRVHSI